MRGASCPLVRMMQTSAFVLSRAVRDPTRTCGRNGVVVAAGITSAQDGYRHRLRTTGDIALGNDPAEANLAVRLPPEQHNIAA